MLVMAVSACGEKEPQHDVPVGGGDIAALVNEWVISSYNDAAPAFVVYIDFNEDGTFAMYQQVYSLNYVCYTGSYNVSDDDILTGTYADGSKWASAYKVSVSTDGKTLMMSSQEDVEDMSVVSVYSQTVIPEDVKLEASETRALEVVPFL